jgi:hypothetical protein
MPAGRVLTDTHIPTYTYTHIHGYPDPPLCLWPDVRKTTWRPSPSSSGPAEKTSVSYSIPPRCGTHSRAASGPAYARTSRIVIGHRIVI